MVYGNDFLNWLGDRGRELVLYGASRILAPIRHAGRVSPVYGVHPHPRLEREYIAKLSDYIYDRSCIRVASHFGQLRDYRSPC